MDTHLCNPVTLQQFSSRKDDLWLSPLELSNPEVSLRMQRPLPSPFPTQQQLQQHSQFKQQQQPASLELVTTTNTTTTGLRSTLDTELILTTQDSSLESGDQFSNKM